MSDSRIAGKEERITVLLDADLKDIIPGFLDDWKQDVNSMRQALDGSDYEAIRKVGHSMKGTCGMCGFDAMSDMGGDLEGAAKKLNPDVIRKTLDMLASYLEQVEVVYE